MNDAAIFLITMPCLVVAGCCFLCCYVRQRRHEDEFLWAAMTTSSALAPSAPPLDPVYTYAAMPTVSEGEDENENDEPHNTI